ncbi:MAG: hypothetical protein A3G34_05395 [Candidatus Lindowbacteria bacterium RIFCSPLOWO2_12_FULL_62_27]|nr:MAG: hypothetical protein A3G34_05395 [Candidatus Lindowbacteria bacterium RIFCSPLOWO2_12_FULL_62_27]OGH63930.1 MAG: hypothetical protein A3I06_03820 [Candidatus Lindowbacteria bacterium RIFCSPLOWO2_02_FULL_62_12]
MDPQEQPKFFMLDDGSEDFYEFPDDWEEDDEEEIEEDVDLKQIVLVDASAFHRNILKSQIEESGYKVVGVVGSAVEARSILTESKVRFAAVDIDQTDGGGAKPIQIIAATNPDTVFIITSARFTADQISQAGMGSFFFLAKPFQKKKVEEILKKAYDAEFAKKKAAAGETPKSGESK